MKKLLLMIAIALIIAWSGTAIASDGSAVYGSKCAGCHGKAGTGTPMAPKLAASKFVEGDGAPLTHVVTTGTSASGKKHPSTKLDKAQLDAIIAYLQGL